MVQCHFAYTPVSPTPISPTYCHSVPFCLLMHNVKKSVLLGKQYSSSLCASQIYGWVCGYLLWGDLVAAELWSLDLEHLFISYQQLQDHQPPWGMAQQLSWSESQRKLTPICSSLLRSSSKNSRTLRWALLSWIQGHSHLKVQRTQLTRTRKLEN